MRCAGRASGRGCATIGPDPVPPDRARTGSGRAAMRALGRALLRGGVRDRGGTCLRRDVYRRRVLPRHLWPLLRDRVAAGDRGPRRRQVHRLEPHRRDVRRARARHRRCVERLPLLERPDLRAQELALLHACRVGVRRRSRATATGRSRATCSRWGCRTPPARARTERWRCTACTTTDRAARRTTATRRARRSGRRCWRRAGSRRAPASA